MYRLDGTEFEEPSTKQLVLHMRPGECFIWYDQWYTIIGPARYRRMNPMLGQSAEGHIINPIHRQLLSWGPRRLGAQDQSLHF